MNNFREWLSDNLRYILLGAGILIIIAGLFFGVRACTSAMKGDAAQVMDETSEDSKGNDPSSPENSGETDEENESTNPMEKNKYPKVNALIQNYYDALGARDVDAIRDVVDELDPTEESKITNARYIEGYENLEVYTKEGLNEGEDVVYAQYDYVCTGIDTPVPALSQIYVKEDSEGELKIYSHAEEDEEVQSYMDSLLEENDVKELIEQVEDAYKKAQESDPDLKAFLEGLGEGEQSETGDTMTVKEGCNIRAEASSDSEVIGSAQAGEEVTRVGEEGEWVQVEYDGQTGYIYGELLE